MIDKYCNLLRFAIFPGTDLMASITFVNWQLPAELNVTAVLLDAAVEHCHWSNPLIKEIFYNISSEILNKIECEHCPYDCCDLLLNVI